MCSHLVSYVADPSFSSALREVVLIPNRHWGGEGLLGCVFGLVRIAGKKDQGLIFTCHSFGLLHRIPSQPVDRLPGTTPIELQQAVEEYEEQELFVPADVNSEPHFSPHQLASWRQQEQEQWHRETAAAQSLYGPTQPRVTPSSRTQGDFRHDHLPHNPNHDYDHAHDFEGGHSGDERTPYRTPRPIDGSLTPTRIPAGPFVNGDSSQP